MLPVQQVAQNAEPVPMLPRIKLACNDLWLSSHLSSLLTSEACMMQTFKADLHKLCQLHTQHYLKCLPSHNDLT